MTFGGERRDSEVAGPPGHPLSQSGTLMPSVRVGILGCGQIAQSAHLPHLRRMPAVEVVALAEADAALLRRARTFAPNAVPRADWRQVVDLPEVDAIVVALPTGLHAEAAVAAFAAGKSVYLEKPIASDLADGRRVLDAWRDSGRIGMVGFHYRLHPLVAELRRQVQRGCIGRVVSARSVFSIRGGALPAWKTERRTGGGVLLDLASHHVDLLRFVLEDEPQHVWARVESTATEADTALVELRFRGGVASQSFFSLCSVEENRIEIFGTDGKLALDLYRSTRVAYASPTGAGWRRELLGIADTAWRGADKMRAALGGVSGPTRASASALAQFVAAVKRNALPTFDIADGFASLAVIAAAERAAESGESQLVDLAPAVLTPREMAPAQPRIAASEDGNPALSVVLLAPDSWRALTTTLRHLRAQTEIARVEMIIVAASASRLGLDPAAVAGFARHRVVEVGPIRSLGHALAAGVHASSAALVAFAEDHAFPHPTWAAALIEAHRGPWAAVGPLMFNANPDTATSWADLLLGYGAWLDPARCGERDSLPGHNSCYRRQVLLEYGDRLAMLLEAETNLHWDLRRKGKRLYQARAVQTRHTNFSRMDSFAASCFWNGRVFGATRALEWDRKRRVLYAAASPLIPFVRLSRIVRETSSAVPRSTLVRALPSLVYGLVLDAIGQMLGYLQGVGRAAEHLSRMEANRADHVTATDRRALFDDADASIVLDGARAR